MLFWAQVWHYPALRIRLKVPQVCGSDSMKIFIVLMCSEEAVVAGWKVSQLSNQVPSEVLTIT